MKKVKLTNGPHIGGLIYTFTFVMKIIKFTDGPYIGGLIQTSTDMPNDI